MNSIARGSKPFGSRAQDEMILHGSTAPYITSLPGW